MITGRKISIASIREYTINKLKLVLEPELNFAKSSTRQIKLEQDNVVCIPLVSLTLSGHGPPFASVQPCPPEK